MAAISRIRNAMKREIRELSFLLVLVYLCEHQKQPAQAGFIENLHIAGKYHRK